MQFPRFVLCKASDATDALARPVVGGRGNVEIPWVAVATGHQTGRFTLAARTSDPDEARALIHTARGHTAALPWQWTVAEQRGFLWFKRPSLLRAYGDHSVSPSELATDGGGIDDLSSEVLLNADAMGAAADQLRSPMIAVTVPKRGWLLAAAAQPGDLGATTPLFAAGGGVAGRGGQHAICGTAVVFVKDGVPCGVEVRSGNGGYVSLGTPNEDAFFT